MAGAENVCDLPLTIRDQGTATTQSSSRVYSNINIGGNARVHLGDAYFDTLTINRLCLVHQANEAIVHQIGNLRSFAEGSAYPPDNDSVHTRIDETNDGIRLVNARLRKSISSTADPAPRKRLVSQTKLSFSLIPLALSFERNVYEEDLEAATSQSTMKPTTRPRTRPTVIVASIWIPRWFAGYQYGICIERSRSGWLYCPRILRESRYETFYMKACSYGWLDKVQSQLVRNRAVVHDRHKDLTGADSALTHGEFHIASFLANQGVQVTINLGRLVREVQVVASTTSQITSAGTLRLICSANQDMTSVNSMDSALKAFELWRDITRQNIAIVRRFFYMEEDEFWDSLLENSSPASSSREFEWLRTLLKYPLWSPEQTISSLVRLVEFWISMYGDKRYALYLVEGILETFESRLPLETLRLEYEYAGSTLTVLHWLFTNVGGLIELNQPINSIWPRYIRYALCAGIEIHTASSSETGPAMTPFWYTCWGYGECQVLESSFFHDRTGELHPRADVDKFIQSLVSVLGETDIDLSAFGKVENSLMKQAILSFRATSSGRSAEPIMWANDIDHLAYGPSPADWRLQYRFNYRKHFQNLMRGWTTTDSLYPYHIIAAIIQFQTQRDGLRIEAPTGTLGSRKFPDIVNYIQRVLRFRATPHNMNDGLYILYQKLWSLL